MLKSTNSSSVMEADTISKNGCSSTNHKSRVNFSGKLGIAVTAVCLFFTTGVFAQQQKGDFAVGAHLSVGTAGFGFGPNVRLNVTDNIRLEGLATIFESDALTVTVGDEVISDTKKWWDAVVNMHYVFSTDTEKKFVPYLIAGVGLLGKASEGTLPVVNIGVGGDFKVIKNLVLNAEVKARAVAPFTIGAAYTF